MSAQTIRKALGLLQDDPDLENAWNELQDAATSPEPGVGADELTKLLDAARRAHEARREWDAVARLLELQVFLSSGSPDEVKFQQELARVFEEELLDDAQATQAYERLLTLLPDDLPAQEALERNEAKRERWRELVDRYLSEMEGADDPAFKSSLLLNAAETTWRFGRSEGLEPIVSYLEQALAVHPRNQRAALLLERIHRMEGKFEEAAKVVESLAIEGRAKDERLAAFLRLGRLASTKLKDTARAARAFEQVLDIQPGQRDAMSYLANYFTQKEEWDYLVALYEDQLRSLSKSGQDVEIYFQIAMVHWRMREKPETAEPWFERLRAIDPSHMGMLNFFREWCTAREDYGRLLSVLNDAQRALPDGEQRSAIGTEIAKLAEEAENTAKAIEQYKALLRQDPDNQEARNALRRLYRVAESWNALVEILRQELERTAADDKETRLSVLREIAEVYRDHIKSETALVTVLTQIVQIDETDVSTIRDLVNVYESLSRWRDLLTYQQKLADLLEDRFERMDLYRAAARRWIEQFSNVQNAIDAYESLLKVEPDDEEARTKLRELYTKRRAWPQLFSLCEQEVKSATGQAKVDLLVEMAKLAAERLDRGADSIALYKEALSVDSEANGVLDALERQAEREKDYATVAEVLERRVDAAPDDQTRLQILQKLGTVYSDRLSDLSGAARAWKRVLQLHPGHSRALRVLRDSYLASNDLEGLEELYASQNDWDGLADVFSSAADRTENAELKVEYSLRSAAVYEQHLNQPERASRSYERILSVHANDAVAAAKLVPIYESEERWSRLPSLYEVLLAHATDAAEKIAILRKLSEISGSKLSDRDAALSCARRAYDVDPASEGALEFLEHAARSAGTWDSFVQALEHRLQQTEEGELSDRERRFLKAKLAEVYAHEQGKVDEAVQTYRQLVQEDPYDLDTVHTLDGILRAESRKEDLRWLFELRIANVEEGEQARLLNEWATLEEEVFGDPVRAVGLFRRVLEIVPTDAEALSKLPKLLLAANDPQGASEILMIRRDLSSAEARAARELDLADLYIGPLAKPEEALQAAVRALELSAGERRAIELLERLMENESTRAQAAEVLQNEYQSLNDPRREANALNVMLDATTDPAERLELFIKLADVQQHKLGSSGLALDVMLRAVAESPTELLLWDRTSDLANDAGRPTDLAEALKSALRNELPERVEVELCERAASLHYEQLGDHEGAVPYLEKVLSRQPTNERAFKQLKQILTSRERWSQLETLYQTVSEATPDENRKVELWAEVALVCEEITSDRAKAIEYYERILQISPLHDQALTSLDSLYQQEKRPRELASLLDRRLAASTDEEGVEIKLRLGLIYFDDLHEPQLALSRLEEVLQIDLVNESARELLERLLEVGSLRSRSAELLERVYEEKDDVRNLVRVLEIRLESAESKDLRRDLLKRVAVLRDERLQDDAGSLEALARLLPLDPADEVSRQRLREIGQRLDANERVANVLIVAAENAEEVSLKGEILMSVAQIYEDLIDDQARAEEFYRKVVELDPDDPLLVLPAARALERIYKINDSAQKLAEILRLQVKLEANGDARQKLWADLGVLCEEILNDSAGSIAAWKSRLDENPSDETSLEALERLYEKTAAWRDLVITLRSREEVTDGEEERRRLLVKAAQTLSEKLNDTAEAIAAWRTVVDEFGRDRPTLAALAALYEKAEQWLELAVTLEQDLELAVEAETQITIYARLGDVRRLHLSDVGGALDAYRQALNFDPSHGPSREALETLLEEPDARRDAAEILHPLYETDGNNEKLLKVLDIEAETCGLPIERLKVLETAVRVAEGPLSDPVRAFNYATRGLREAVGDSSLRDWLERAESLTSVTGRYAELVTVLSEIARDVFDEQMQLEVTIRVAELARNQLKETELARDWYQKALDINAEEKRALVALESLYKEMEEFPALLEILKRRVEIAETKEESKELLYREAVLTRDVLKEKEQAITVYEAILDIALDAPAVEALENLYTETERYFDLVHLYERQIDESQGNHADLHVKLAKVAEKNLSDVSRAFDELEKALEYDTRHAGAVAVLEGLLENAEEPVHRARAGEMLEPVYVQPLNLQRLMRCIDARLQASHDPTERKTLLKRLAQLYEEQAENWGEALTVTAKLLHEELSDEETWSELERLAKVDGAEARLAEIYAKELAEVTSDEPATAKLSRRTGELYASLDNIEQALVFYRRALAFEPESRELFASIDMLLIKAELPAERVELYRGALDYRFEPKDRLATLHIIAGLEEDSLNDVEKAIETYRAAVDVDERDGRALDALTRLYRQSKRFRDLAELYERRADLENDLEIAATYRLELARLLTKELEDVSAGIDQLEMIVGDSPWNKQAIAELEKLSQLDDHKQRIVEILRPLYERADDWRDLIRLNEQGLSLAQDDLEKVRIYRENAELFEQRASDVPKAFASIQQAFALNPEDTEIRAELDRLAEQLSAWDELAASYEQAIESSDEIIVKRELLDALAEVHDLRRDDPRLALEAYDRLAQLDETNIEPLEAMDGLAMMLSDWPTVVRVLTKKAELVLGDDERASIWRRIGEAKRDMIEDVSGAIEAYEQALEYEMDNVFTVDCLIDLYEDRDEPKRLVELYRARVDLAGADEADSKYDWLTRAAGVYETKLGDRREAIDALREALDARQADKQVLRSLDRLLRAEEMWPDLLDNLRLEAGSADSVEERVQLRRAMGDLFKEKLDEPKDALMAYQQVLEEAPTDDHSIAAVREIGETREFLRTDAADILEPVLRNAERWEDLVVALELRLRAQSEATERSATLRDIARVLESKLSSAQRAESALLRALVEVPDDAELHSEISRLADACDGYAPYADALSERAGAIFGSVAKDLYVRLGRISEEKLKDESRAIDAYKAAVNQEGDDPALLAALDRLYTKTNASHDLADVLERLVVAEMDSNQRAEQYYRLAMLQLTKFEDVAAALGTLRSCLESSQTHTGAREALEKLTDDRDLFEDVAATLNWVYREQGDFEALVKLLEKRIAFSEEVGERVPLRQELARVLEEKVGDPKRAQAALEEALNDDPSDDFLLTELERLAPITDGFASAAEALNKAVGKSETLIPTDARDLYLRLATWYRDRLNDNTSAEKALEKALERDSYSLDIIRALEQLRRVEGRERDLVETLRKRAKLETDFDQKRELLKEAKLLAEETVKDNELAEAILRQLLQENEADLWGIQELTKLREAANDYKEATELLLRASELVEDGAQASELKHRAAEAKRFKLEDAKEAIDLYDELFEADLDDVKASKALRELYESEGRFHDLSSLLQRLIDVASSSEQRTALRIDLARLQNEKLNSVDDAIFTLQAVLDEEQGNEAAVVALSQLYEKTGRDDDMAELLNRQIELAIDRSDTSAELAFKVRLGEIYENKLRDQGKAIETYQAVLERNPEHKAALHAVARLFEAKGDSKAASEALEKLLSLESGADAVAIAVRLADMYLSGKDDAAARVALEKGYSMDPAETAVRDRLRKLYERVADWAKLAELIADDASRASETPQKVALFQKAAEIRQDKLEDPSGAAELLEKASELVPDDRNLLLALCDAYSASGRGKDAAMALEKIIESYGGRRSKELAGIHHRLGRAYLAQGDKERALAEFDSSFKIDPGAVVTLRDLGTLTLGMDDLERAQKVFRALLLQRLDASSPISKAEVYYYLGEISHRQGDNKKALPMLERAIESDSSLDKARELRDKIKAG
jgi:golgin subfamily B member 1